MADCSVQTAARKRGRRARRCGAAGVLAATALLAGAGVAGSVPVAAAPGIAAPPCRQGQNCQTPTPRATPCDTFNQNFEFVPCPSPSPSFIVITPLPSDSPTPNVTPAYLIGLTPSPTDIGQDTGGIVAPLGGGTNTNPPNAGGGGGSPSSTLSSTGLPLPLFFLGLVVASAAAGFILWRYAPRGKKLPQSQGPPPILFTPYGSSEGAPANLLDPTVNRRRD